MSLPGRRLTCGARVRQVLLDTEGIDAYDQTGQYSTQIFSLAVLLSSLFVYNQMGGIDEAALDRLSLVTEVTKHVRVRAGGAAGARAAACAASSPTTVKLLPKPGHWSAACAVLAGACLQPRAHTAASFQPPARSRQA